MEEEEEDTEVQAITPPETQVSRPLLSILADPVNLLHVEQITKKGAYSRRSGRWASVKAKKATPIATRDYAVRLGPAAIPQANLYVYQNGKSIQTMTTDSNGKARLNLPTNKPMYSSYKVSMVLPETQAIPFAQAFPFAEGLPTPPIEDIFTATVWVVTVKVKNKTDRWWRLAGRDLTGDLPRKFWTKGARYTIGLAAPYGTQVFVDILPLFGDSESKVKYGISAYCNTRSGYPTRSACLAARLGTWWAFEIEAFNAVTKATVTGDLNIDRQLEVTFKSNSISGKVVKSPGAET